MNYIIFSQNLCIGSKVLFEKDTAYEVLDEDEVHYYVQTRKHTNEVCQIPKKVDGNFFALVMA